MPKEDDLSIAFSTSSGNERFSTTKVTSAKPMSAKLFFNSFKHISLSLRSEDERSIADKPEPAIMPVSSDKMMPRTCSPTDSVVNSCFEPANVCMNNFASVTRNEYLP